jgi:hypothetical protein
MDLTENVCELSHKTQDTLDRLNEYKTTYPQLIHLWEKTILKYEQNLFKVLNECEKMLSILPNFNEEYDLEEICNAITIHQNAETIS